MKTTFLTSQELSAVGEKHSACDPPCVTMMLAAEVAVLRAAAWALREGPEDPERCEHGHTDDDCPHTDCKLMLARGAVVIFEGAAERCPENARLMHVSSAQAELLVKPTVGKGPN